MTGPRITRPEDLDSINEMVRGFFGGSPSRPYVVTDCDVDLSIADHRALRIYGELLDRFAWSECVGPMLRVRDIPTAYPLRNRALNRHVEQFWGQQPKWTRTSAGPTAFLAAPIDTTFALHRRGEDFHRLKHGIRVYFPFEARHLDWYPAADGRDGRDGRYAESSSVEISHWNNRRQRVEHADEPLRFDHLIYVDRGRTGDLETRRLALRDPGGGQPR